jgi:hypothetical protein
MQKRFMNRWKSTSESMESGRDISLMNAKLKRSKWVMCGLIRIFGELVNGEI